MQSHKLQIMKACALSSHNELLESHINHVPNMGLESWFFFQFWFLWYPKFGRVLQIFAKWIKFKPKENFQIFPIFLKKGWNHSLVDLHVKGHFTWQSKDQFEANWALELDTSSHFKTF